MHQSHPARPPNVRIHNNYNPVPPPPQMMHSAHYMGPQNNIQPGPPPPPQGQQMMAQYISTTHQQPQTMQQQARPDKNRLIHHMQQQQQQQPSQRISPQMHQSQTQPTHHTAVKSRQQLQQQLPQQHTHQQQSHQSQPNIIHGPNINQTSQNVMNSVKHQINSAHQPTPSNQVHINSGVNSLHQQQQQQQQQLHYNIIHNNNKNLPSSMSNNNIYHGKINNNKIVHINNNTSTTNINNNNPVVKLNPKTQQQYTAISQPHLSSQQGQLSASNTSKTNLIQTNEVIHQQQQSQTAQHSQTQVIHQNAQQTPVQASTSQPQITILKNNNKSLQSSIASSVPNKIISTVLNTHSNITTTYNIPTKNVDSIIVLQQSKSQSLTSSANIIQTTNPLETAIIKSASQSKETINKNIITGNISTLPSTQHQNNPENINKETMVLLTEDPKSTILPVENLQNIKEKTPMCLVNELARYNKIQHQYRLTGEEGPAHNKCFTVTLKLGDEEYSAQGPSIKKAQHTAAAEAVGKTKYDHPPPKAARHKNTNRSGVSSNITPTVELNALAMKLGEPTIYVFDSPPAHPGAQQTPHFSQMNQGNRPSPAASSSTNFTASQYQSDQYGQHKSYFNNIYVNGGGRSNGRGRPYTRGGLMKFNSNQRMNPQFGFFPNVQRDACKITLVVGEQKFVGTGPTVQLAKHDAASKALEVLKPLAEAAENCETLNNTLDDSNTDVKSPISQVHEMALKRNLSVTFEVKSEIGPPHMKTFITICKVGTVMTEGEGNGKKISKKRAAEKMLEELKKLPPPSPEKTAPTVSNMVKCKRGRGGVRQQHQGQSVVVKKKAKNLIKEKNIESAEEVVDEINPISRLIQIQQSLKEREPIYTVIEEKGAPRRREFTIEVTAGSLSARGSGSNKKMAKKIAAKNLLILMGHETTANGYKETSLTEKANECKTTNKKEISTTVLSQSGATSRQIVPGVIHLPTSINTLSSPEQNNMISKPQLKQQILSEIPEEKCEKSNTSGMENNAESDSENNSESVHEMVTDTPRLEIQENNLNEEEGDDDDSKEFGVRPKDQLLYLAQILGFQAMFTDYPKGNHGEYLTIVTLSTDPPQICHGAGADTIDSQDKAALKALQMLQELKLDNVVKPKTKIGKK